MLNSHLVDWERDTEQLIIGYPDLLFLRFWTPGLLQGFIFWRCPVDRCGIVLKFDDKRRHPKYQQCLPYPPIYGDVTQERKQEICRACLEHLLHEHRHEVPVSRGDGMDTGYVREENGRKRICMYQPWKEEESHDDGTDDVQLNHSDT